VAARGKRSTSDCVLPDPFIPHPTMRPLITPLIVLLLAAPLTAQSRVVAARPSPIATDSTYREVSALTWRNIGPSRGGRANAVAGIPGQPLTYFAGYTGGGVWRTDDAGISWRNISDGFFKTSSIGAIAVAPSSLR